ncbi:AAA family ATPase [Actinomadura sp. LD22]|uniref:DNA 3'-5' helicase n=1 Tax=Actinomadura physcomitrii TaxID=2650748 RepID=A0A6I4MP89_9ACTN|nr:UvrD-helicase domain-containing protein [Actinomadura physcomitrii]MWA06525.1 AAA family ATPase [Actinomadura physcomitrii]
MSEPGEGLTDEQIAAVCSRSRRTYIEAAPGSGKTTVAAMRFGLHRFTGTAEGAVVGLSFTRAATNELQQRIRLRWGAQALTWPHRVMTFDAFLERLLGHLLELGLVKWPGGLTAVTVNDTWKGRARQKWGTRCPTLVLKGRAIAVGTRPARQDSHVEYADFVARVNDGECTHDEVRAVLEAALDLEDVRGAIARLLIDSIGALIVDEIYDANRLDLRLVELACLQGLRVTIIGDPWQALYGFRGASPDLVPDLVAAQGFVRLPLTRSFRFSTDQARTLSERLRQGQAVTLPAKVLVRPDIVLAGTWKQLWECPPSVLPASFGTPETTNAAAILLLLDRLTTTTLGERAVFLPDALAGLDIGEEALNRLADPLSEILESMRGSSDIDAAYRALIRTVGEESTRLFKRKHPTSIRKLELIRTRLLADGPGFVPGLTVHQAKGREWNDVGVRLTEKESSLLSTGLRSGQESHRRLYVALTRARRATTPL